MTKQIQNEQWIKIKGAKVNNLKNIDINIPKNKLVVVTGVSGSGKSSLAFDTLYQEGKRRYVESLSTYARQFLGSFEKPDVSSIEGLSPAISIDQKTTSHNPRSTVGTITEIYDYLRLIYANISIPYDPVTNMPLEQQDINQIFNQILKNFLNQKISIIAPFIERKKGTHKKNIENLVKNGYYRLIIDQKIFFIDNEQIPILEKNNYHDIFIIIDQLQINHENKERLYDSLEQTIKITNNQIFILTEENKKQKNLIFYKFNQKYQSDNINFSIPQKESRLFSFNTPLGACNSCKGLGIKSEISKELILDMNQSLKNGGILPYKNNHENNLSNQTLESVCKKYNIDMHIPIKNIEPKLIDIILYGSADKINFQNISSSGIIYKKYDQYPGIINIFEKKYEETTSEWLKKWLKNFIIEKKCFECKGQRLNKGALLFKINNKNICEITEMSIEKLLNFIIKLKKEITEYEKNIINLALKEIIHRLTFLKEIGLGYLTLSRNGNSLSGGEAQRIRLATQIGSKLSGVLYVLDEPSIGLHQKDNYRLIEALKNMRNLGNSVIVVEHDYETMLSADFVIDMGPKAGNLGGEITAFGSVNEIINNPQSLTGKYLSNKKQIQIPKQRRIKTNNKILVTNANKNNLKNLKLSIPLEQLVVVTGVSGSGKSTLVNQIITDSLQQKYSKNTKKTIKDENNLVEDYNFIKKISAISQSPIGKTPRSNPVTYTGIFDHIRDLYAKTKDSQIKGFQKGRFSFNVKGGRCEYCQGDGVQKIIMHFLPDIFVTCENCNGQRYNKATLEIKYKNKNIYDILNMTIDESVIFFQNQPKIHHKLQILQKVGLGYIKLGQSATTLSGGEAQRIKLASELHKKIIKGSLYIFDEPTTGLHMEDINQLLKIIHQMIDQGASIIIIEHNLDIIKNADYIIDLGPEGGDKGGNIVGTGTPEELSQNINSYTGKYLKKILLN